MERGAASPDSGRELPSFSERLGGHLAADLETLRTSQDLYRAGVDSRKRVIGRPIVFVRRLTRYLLRPFFLQQSEHNRAAGRLISRVVEQVEARSLALFPGEGIRGELLRGDAVVLQVVREKVDSLRAVVEEEVARRVLLEKRLAQLESELERQQQQGDGE